MINCLKPKQNIHFHEEVILWTYAEATYPLRCPDAAV